MGRRDLIRRASDLMGQCFEIAPDAVGIAPGRVELLGNHTDYNEGWVLTAAVAPSTAVAVK
ncbi:MAG: galactokinase family protein, partial [Armatimonadaceae bacterium]